MQQRKSAGGGQSAITMVELGEADNATTTL
jgi:hypothetical protein